MAGKKIVAGEACPRCAEQLIPTAYGSFCLACGYTEYGNRSPTHKGEKISHRDVKEIKDGKKRDI
jgi:Zn ribbon nucleic-acid-binding protein